MGELVKIHDRQIERISYKGKSVVTLKMIDEVHERTSGTARRNFHKNRERFVEGEDYFVCETYEARKDFGITAPCGLILLAEPGYLMLVKSLTDKLSWYVQRQLVDSYFRAKQQQSHNVPMTYEEALEAHLASVREANRLQRQIEANKPKVEFANNVTTAANAMDLGEFAKILGTGRTRLFRWLKERGYLMASNKPYQKYADREWFTVIETTFAKGDESHVYAKTLIAGNGQVAIEKAWRAENPILPEFMGEPCQLNSNCLN
jgi:phage antirepressor YoqD-like protein